MIETKNDDLAYQLDDIFDIVRKEFARTIEALKVSGELPPSVDPWQALIGPPRDPSHGDFASNIALVLAKEAAKKPRELADAIAERLRVSSLIEKVDVAGPGFINLTLKPTPWIAELRKAVRAEREYGRNKCGEGRSVNVEYISANPTGPMHIGHCRGAVFGDALANLLDFTGFSVTREYYINDAGAQVDALARSVYWRYSKLRGRELPLPDGFYPGPYLDRVSLLLAASCKDELVDKPESEWIVGVRQAAVEAMLVNILEDLERLNIEFDIFFSEKGLSEGVAKFTAVGAKPAFYCALKSYDLINGPPGGVRDYFTRRAIARAPGMSTVMGFSEDPVQGELGQPGYLNRTLQVLSETGLVYEGHLLPPKGGNRRRMGRSRADLLPLD